MFIPNRTVGNNPITITTTITTTIGQETPMKKDLPRVMFIVIDQMAGHWVDGVMAEGDFPPVNIWGYHKKGLIPNISRLIAAGLWAPAWNMRECDTAHGMKYLASGRYNHKSFWGGEGKGRFYAEEDKEDSLFEFAKKHHRGNIRVAVFTTDLWIAKGYFYTPEDMHAFPSYFPDDPMWHDMALPWLRKNANWDLVHIYFATNGVFAPWAGRTAGLKAGRLARPMGQKH
jgi:hypothetical protein